MSNRGKQKNINKDASSDLKHVSDYVVKSVFIACIEPIIAYVTEHVVQVFIVDYWWITSSEKKHLIASKLLWLSSHLPVSEIYVEEKEMSAFLCGFSIFNWLYIRCFFFPFSSPDSMHNLHATAVLLKPTAEWISLKGDKCHCISAVEKYVFLLVYRAFIHRNWVNVLRVAT